jgi:hypothetical protein
VRRATLTVVLGLALAASAGAAEPAKGGNPFADPRVQEAFEKAGIRLPDWKPVKDEALGCKVLVPTAWERGKDFFLERAPPFKDLSSGGFETSGNKPGWITTKGGGPASGLWQPPASAPGGAPGGNWELRSAYYQGGKPGCQIRRTRTDRPFTEGEKAEFRRAGQTVRLSP